MILRLCDRGRMKTPHEKSPHPTDLASEVQALIDAGTAKTTRVSYVRDVRYFWAWARLRLNKRPRYPVALAIVQQFIVDHVKGLSAAIERPLIEQRLRSKPGPLKLATIKRNLSSLSAVQQEHGHDSLLAQAQVRLLLRRARRATAGTQVPVQKAAITLAILKRLVATCHTQRLHDVRDKALLYLGFASGGRRRSELTHLLVEDVRAVGNDYVIRIRKSKTDQDGDGFEVPLFGTAALALRTWLTRGRLKEGYLFRGIRNDETLNGQFTGKAINLMIKNRIAMIGLDPKEFGAHSLRSGFVTEAAQSGIPLAQIMQLSGHRDPEVAQGYIRAQALSDHPVRRLFK
jgi:integrase